MGSKWCAARSASGCGSHFRYNLRHGFARVQIFAQNRRKLRHISRLQDVLEWTRREAFSAGKSALFSKSFFCSGSRETSERGPLELRILTNSAAMTLSRNSKTVSRKALAAGHSTKNRRLAPCRSWKLQYPDRLLESLTQRNSFAVFTIWNHARIMLS